MGGGRLWLRSHMEVRLYLLPSQLVLVLAPNFLLPRSRDGLNRCSHCTKVRQKTNPIFKSGAAQLRRVPEIAPPQTFLCVNRRTIGV